MKKVLVLNADYTALTICNIYKAFLLIFMGKAEVVDKFEDCFLKSMESSFQAPSIVRLHNYVNVPHRKISLSRQNIFRRDGQRCVYCRSQDSLTLDHVTPKSKGGKDEWTNLVAACKKCNAKKGHATLEEAGMTLPYQPFKPSFVVFLKYFSGLGHPSWERYLRC